MSECAVPLITTGFHAGRSRYRVRPAMAGTCNTGLLYPMIRKPRRSCGPCTGVWLLNSRMIWSNSTRQSETRRGFADCTEVGIRRRAVSRASRFPRSGGRSGPGTSIRRSATITGKLWRRCARTVKPHRCGLMATVQINKGKGIRYEMLRSVNARLLN